MTLLMTIVSNQLISSFESQARNAFAFLETEREMTFAGVKEIKGDPRDSGIVVRYRSEVIRIDIGFNEAELSLAILIRLNRDELPRQARHLYLDAFVEFISDGKKLSVVPQIYPRMSEKRLFEVMGKRQELFQKEGLSAVLGKLAEQLRSYVDEIQKVKPEVIRDYQQWYESGGNRKATG
jgi:hypothetical protein